MYAYCENNPVNASDPKGEFINTICGAIIGGFADMLTRDKSSESAWDAFKRGAVTGAIAGACLDIAVATGGVGGVVIAAAGGAVASVIDTSLESRNTGKKANVTEYAVNAVVGGGVGMLFGSAGRTAGRAIGKTVGTVMKAAVDNTVKSVTSGSGKFLISKCISYCVNGLLESTVAAGGYKLLSFEWNTVLG